MSNKTVNCKVLSHGDGPACEQCGRPMDSILVTESDQAKPYKAHYCYRCAVQRGR